jgi:hypothetical protein
MSRSEFVRKRMGDNEQRREDVKTQEIKVESDEQWS